MEPTKPDGAARKPSFVQPRVPKCRIYVLLRHLVDYSPGSTVLFKGFISETGMSRDLSKRPTTSDTSRSPVPKVDQETLTRMLPEVYEELRRLAASYLRKERSEHTLQRTALVHEAYLRLAKQHEGSVWGDRAHFFAIFARVMRETLTNYAVARHRTKRGGTDPAERALEFYEQRKIDIGALDLALKDLEALDPKQAQIVELRFFIGLTVPEIASLMQISPATVKREWAIAKVWLRRELSRNN
jgi:RNA polymerase sigma-70 factor (ECF subfamily)